MIDSNSPLLTIAAQCDFPKLVQATLEFARAKHPVCLRSRHEGWGVILDELNELQETIYKKYPSIHVLIELASVAAMCQRMAEDVIHSELLQW